MQWFDKKKNQYDETIVTFIESLWCFFQPMIFLSILFRITKTQLMIADQARSKHLKCKRLFGQLKEVQFIFANFTRHFPESQ